MLDWVKQWLMGITAAALLVAAAESLMPRGTVRRLGRLTGGLVLLLAVLAPVQQLDERALARALAEYHLPVEEVEAMAQANAGVLESLIAEKTGAYISDKAAEVGAECTIRVETRAEEDGYPVPWAVTIEGTFTAEERRALTRCIEADLAIPPERQTYRSTEETT